MALGLHLRQGRGTSGYDDSRSMKHTSLFVVLISFIAWLKVRNLLVLIKKECARYLIGKKEVTKFLASDLNFDRLKISNPLFSIVIIGD